ncbi:MAG: DUF3035 domain-containing protein [Hyphomonadaceae bacterium]|nr:DUF3035 domain-containing protein [Hyphomonadaceae bacterium]
MANKITTVLAIAVAAATTTGCNTLSRALGATKVTPDEFRVVTSAPLTLPPDYSLRPPAPGAPRPQELAPDQEARAALFGQDIGQNASAGERALVAGAGAEAVDAEARQTVDFESQSIVHRNEAFADRVLAQSTQAPTPEQQQAEAEAIRRATGGGEVTIERDGGGIKLPGT